jgi:cytosine/adenosine deaminase-related metal-dependent hydrolase
MNTIRNLQAILTGLPGEAARHAGPDIRVADGVIAAIGKLDALPGESVIDAGDCVAYPAWVNTHHHLFQSLLKGDPLGINARSRPGWRPRPIAIAPSSMPGCSAWPRASAWSN